MLCIQAFAPARAGVGEKGGVQMSEQDVAEQLGTAGLGNFLYAATVVPRGQDKDNELEPD